MIKILDNPKHPHTATCTRCGTRFSYETIDLSPNYVRGGEGVCCPGCGEWHRHSARSWINGWVVTCSVLALAAALSGCTDAKEPERADPPRSSFLQPAESTVTLGRVHVEVFVDAKAGTRCYITWNEYDTSSGISCVRTGPTGSGTHSIRMGDREITAQILGDTVVAVSIDGEDEPVSSQVGRFAVREIKKSLAEAARINAEESP